MIRERQQQAYGCLAFGHGRRSCIGRRLAEHQLHLLAGRLVQEWRLAMPPAAAAGVEYTTRMIGVPSKEIELQLEPVR
jgi:cytochrome P450